MEDKLKLLNRRRNQLVDELLNVERAMERARSGMLEEGPEHAISIVKYADDSERHLQPWVISFRLPDERPGIATGSTFQLAWDAYLSCLRPAPKVAL